jgi:K+-sensing histidine kinase KdpD
LKSIPNPLLSIFGDIILLDTSFCIVGASRLILSVLNYRLEEITGKHIGEISNHPNLEACLREQLTNDFFEDQEYHLRTGCGHQILVSFSGSYVPLMGHIEGYVLLKVKDIQEIRLIHEQLEEKILELDHFLYRASHDLRGPLTTIMGLAHVAILEKLSPDQLFYLQEILKHADKLDNTLKNLLYIANSGIFEHEHKGILSIDRMEAILRSVVSNHGGDEVEFCFKVDLFKITQLNELECISLLKNILVALLELPKQTVHQRITILMRARKNHLLLDVFASGFCLDERLSEKFRKTYLSCSEVLHSSNLVHFYVARKIVHKLRGTLEAFLSEKNQHIFVRIPVPMD